MTEAAQAFGKVLIPYDGSSHARQALQFGAALARRDRLVKHITVLRVIGGGYLARHIQNVDLRVTRMDQVEAWQRVRQHYLEQEITPQLQEAKTFLQEQGVAIPVETRFAEGRPGEEIVKLAAAEGFNGIIMGRRGLSPVKELLLGGVTRTVLLRARGVTIFVAGSEGQINPDCPITPMLLPVDGSEPSLAAVRQAALLTRAFGEHQVEMTLLHVIDLALLTMVMETGAHRLVEEGEAILAQSRELLQQAGFGGPMQEKLLYGRPADAIADYGREHGVALILMGHKGRSVVADLLIGSVASEVVHRSTRSTVGIVCL
ncbi:MAG: universal stress protein [Deltaproteobacteria bacterium]|nr:universal stress protein [Deltaproteobacteria bacterium]